MTTSTSTSTRGTASAESTAAVLGRVAGTLAGRLWSAIHASDGRAGGTGRPASGWLVVTVLRDPADIDPASLPAPLQDMADRIDVEVRAAPDGKGAELAARLREPVRSSTALKRLSGSDPESDLRSALRRSKQLLEVGEVLAVDPAPHGERTATPGGVMLEAWTKAESKAGVR